MLCPSINRHCKELRCKIKLQIRFAMDMLDNHGEQLIIYNFAKVGFVFLMPANMDFVTSSD